MADYNGKSQFSILADFFIKHPGLTISFAYALLTLCGVFYSFSYYARFDIPILMLVDVSDLLIAGISDPAALFVFSGAVLIPLIFDPLYKKTFDIQTRWREKPKSVKRLIILALCYTPKTNFSVLLSLVLLFVLYAFTLVSSYTEYKSNGVKKGEGTAVVLYSDDALYNRVPLMLLGSTANYVMFYQEKTNASLVLPIESIKSVVVKPSVTEEDAAAKD